LKGIRAVNFASLLAGFATAIAFAGVSLGDEPAKPRSNPTVNLIKINGSINPAVAGYIEDSIRAAPADKVQALVIELDTPGGLLSSAKQIVKDLLGAPVPVVVYVAPAGSSAASAGMFITMAANIAAMAPGTTIGAAHPVNSGGGDIEGAAGKKLENFTASLAVSIAQQRGRNQKWAEDAVRNSAVIGDREALQTHVIDIVARDLGDLLEQLNGRTVKIGSEERRLDTSGAIVVERHMSTAQGLLNLLSDPNVVYLLLMGGMIGLYFEFAHPGVFLPGVVGAICLLLALASFQVLPINLSGLLLVLLGIGLLISEGFITSHGVLGMGGVVAFVIGSLFLTDSSKTNLTVSRSLIAGAALALTGIIVAVGYVIARNKRGPAATGLEGMIGAVGEVKAAISPQAPGKIFVRGELWRAAAPESIDAGTRAAVTAVHGMEVEVRKVAN
jgi:membrane-bound serine protease (ClpP class)